MARKSRRSRVGSTSLALLVGLTLTLVCQGHIHGNERIGPHLTFLGALDHGLYGHSPYMHTASANDTPQEFAGSSTDNQSMDMAGMDMSGMDMQAMAISVSDQLAILISASADTSAPAGTPSGSAGANIASAVTTPPLESESIATLSFMLLIFLLWRNSELFPLEIAATAARRSQTTLMPEPPPPRHSLICA